MPPRLPHSTRSAITATRRARPGSVTTEAACFSFATALSAEDAALYEEAKAIVNAAKAASGGDPLAPESYLYNYVSLVAVYDGSANEPVRNERTALDERMTAHGALLSGRANCQGFSDAFYLPASLSGFVVRRE